MQTPFSDNGYISKNGRQSSLHREHAIYSSIKRGSILNLNASPERMEKLFIIVFSFVGYGSVIGGILLNLANWKSDILFLMGCFFMLLKFIRIVIRTGQSYRREQIEQAILKKKLKDSEE